MTLPKVGVEAVIEGMSKFEADSKKINKSVDQTGTALDTMAARAAAAGLKFDEASGRWRRATGQFASDAELAAAGIKKVGDEAGATGSKFGGLGFSIGSLVPSFSGLGSVVGRIGPELVGLGNSILKIGTIAGGVALAGVTAFGAGLATFAAGGVQKATDLDQKMSDIAATMGIAKQQAAGLKDLILDLSLNPDLTVNTTQAAQAIEVLAANGAELVDVMGNVTESGRELTTQVVAMSNATGADFAVSAAIATDAMALFGLEASEMGKAVDGATGVMVASKFGAVDYQLALANAGSVAASTGLSIEDFNTILAGTASNFASGSDAGTALKTFLQQLSSPTKEAKAAMEQYGISLFNADGSMRAMKDVVGDLNRVFTGTVTLTSQVGGATKEQAKAAETASKNIGDLTRDIQANKDKLKLMTDVYQESLKFYDAGEPKMRGQALAIQNLTNNITDQEEKLAGYQNAIAAVDGAQVRTITSTKQLTDAEKAYLAETLAGSDGVRILNGLTALTAEEFEALSLQVNETGQGLTAAATRVDSFKGAMEIFKGVVEAVQIQVGDKFLPLLRQAAVSFTGLAAESGPMVVDFFGRIAESIGSIITKGQELFAIFQAEGAGGLLTALGIGPDGIELFSKVSTLITDVSTSISTMLTPALSSLTSSGIMGSLNTGLSFLNEHFEEIKGALAGIAAVAAAGVLVALGTAIAGLVGPVTLLVAAAATLGAAWTGNWFGIRDTLTNVWATVQPILSDLWTWLSTSIPPAIQTLSDIWNNTLLPGFTEIYNAVSTQVLPALQDLFNVFTSGTGGTQTLSDLWNNTLLPALTAVGNFVVNTLFPAWVDLEVFLAGALATAIQALADYWENWVFPAMGKVSDAIGVMSDLWTNTLQPALLSANDGISVVVDLLDSLGELINAVINKALEAMAGLWKNVLQPALVSVGNILKDKIEPALTSIGKTVKKDVSPVLTDLGETVFPLLQEGLDYVTEAIKDVIGYFDSLTGKVKGFTLPDILTPGSPPPMAYALMDIAAGANQAGQAMALMGEATQQAAQISQSALDTLFTGMTVQSDAFKKDFIDDLNMGSILDKAGAGGRQRRNFRNIVHDAIGGNMHLLESGDTGSIFDIITREAQRFKFPPGMAQEFTRMEGLVGHLTGTFGTMFEKMRIGNLAAAAGIIANFNSIGGSFAGMLQEQMDAFDKSKAETAKLGEENTKLTGTLTTQQEKLAGLQAELVELSKAEVQDTEAKKKKQEEIAKLTAEIDKNKEAIQKNQQAVIAYRMELQKKAFSSLDPTASARDKLEGDLALIETLQNFLAGAEKTITVVGKKAGEDVLSGNIFNRVEAQQKLNQLLVEQKKREEEITKQKEMQQKLDFLMQQINLVKLLSDRGLNPANILGGIKLGLQAGVGDLLAATNRVVEAMIGQINQDLQIRSPSRVMFRIGEQIMAGLQAGVISMTPVLNTQLSASVAGPISPMMAGALGAGSVTNYNITNQLGGNNFYNQQDDAIFEAKVLRVIQRALS